MSKKIAQNTKLDTTIQHNKLPARWYSDYSDPQVKLPFKDWDIKNEISNSIKNIKDKEIEQDVKNNIKSINFNYPELSHEQLNYKNISPEKLKEVEEKNKLDKEKHDQAYNNPEHPVKFYPDRIEELSKLSPDELKKRLLVQYNEFRNIANKFYQAYKEANSYITDGKYKLNYTKSYIEIFKEIPKLIINEISKEIGELFGDISEGRRRYNYSNKLSQLASFIRRGINIFNVNPENFDEKIKELYNASNLMEEVLAEYYRKKKLLNKLPELVNNAQKEYLSKKINRDFLKWMDVNYKGNKEEFIGSLVQTFYYNSNKRSNGLSFDEIRKLKTYKSIYEKSIDASTHRLTSLLKHNSYKEFKKGISETIIDIIKNKSLALYEISKNRDFNDLKKYLYKSVRFDIGSIFNFLNMFIEKETAPLKNDMDSDEEKENYEKAANIINNKKKSLLLEYFFDNFTSIVLNNFIKSTFNLSNEISRIIDNKYSKYFLNFNKENINILDNLSSKELEIIANEIIRDRIIEAIPNIKGNDYNRKSNVTNFPKINKLLNETGKFSIDGLTNYISSYFTNIPKDFALNLARNIFKNMNSSSADDILNKFKLINNFSNLQDSRGDAKYIFVELLKKSSKFSPDNFTKYISKINNINEEIQLIYREIPRLDKDLIYQIFIKSIRNIDTLDQDLKNLKDFANFIHNEASNLQPKEVLSIINNKNFNQFAKSGIIQKILGAYALIKGFGTITKIKKDNGKIITDLIKNKYISKDFYKNISFILNFFKSNEEINPSSEKFKQAFEISSAIETDLEIIEMSETFKELLKDYEPKDINLFKLNETINEKYRFRVLKDRDPRTLRIGIETDCCQRIGGAADSAAKDSFVNPLAGVVVLEYNNHGNWELLAQSYFHYIPKDNGFILDNVETNAKNVSSTKTKLEPLYAKLAEIVKEKYNVNYFLAGKGYSKIDNNKFQKAELDEDPRSFSNKATKSSYSGVYTDFNHRNAIDLLAPKKDEEINPIKQAFTVGLRKMMLIGMQA